ncbi:MULTISPECIES: pentapeptide repeat-containing protein [unclassified Synechocystis]|uniref:pentapeptide repeat-containing protein n=1 Tax=unclassified Synechocystis TaxID=2640012 RepID=UPI0003F8E724|nr:MULTISPECIES: pentapeptide repeat-containing protein [unclassified Synechocystis]MCT0255095.1 pentapeptide repeat-containing protein [Synechocystis sp. CS-94]
MNFLMIFQNFLAQKFCQWLPSSGASTTRNRTVIRWQPLVQACFVVSAFGLAIFALAGPSGALDYNRGNLVGADFSHQDLHGSIFDHSNLRGADFTGANIQGARFFSANMDGAILEGADARSADFESARLTHANLRNARLEGSFGTNTKFGEVDIEGADLTDIILRPDTEEYLCERAKGTNPVTGRQTKDTLFCP